MLGEYDRGITFLLTIFNANVAGMSVCREKYIMLTIKSSSPHEPAPTPCFIFAEINYFGDEHEQIMMPLAVCVASKPRLDSIPRPQIILISPRTHASRAAASDITHEIDQLCGRPSRCICLISHGKEP